MGVVVVSSIVIVDRKCILLSGRIGDKEVGLC